MNAMLTARGRLAQAMRAGNAEAAKEARKELARLHVLRAVEKAQDTGWDRADLLRSVASEQLRMDL